MIALKYWAFFLTCMASLDVVGFGLFYVWAKVFWI